MGNTTGRPVHFKTTLKLNKTSSNELNHPPGKRKLSTLSQSTLTIQKEKRSLVSQNSEADLKQPSVPDVEVTESQTTLETTSTSASASEIDSTDPSSKEICLAFLGLLSDSDRESRLFQNSKYDQTLFGRIDRFREREGEGGITLFCDILALFPQEHRLKVLLKSFQNDSSPYFKIFAEYHDKNLLSLLCRRGLSEELFELLTEAQLGELAHQVTGDALRVLEQYNSPEPELTSSQALQ